MVRKQQGNPKQKKQAEKGITLAALCLALAGAVYLNWNFAKEAPQAVAAGENGETAAVALTQEEPAAAVSADTVLIDPLQADAQQAAVPVDDVENTEGTANKNYGEAQLVSVSKDSGSEFFEAARLSRDKTRDEALDAIKKTLKNADLDEEEKTKLTEKLQSQVNSITVESGIETVIKAKGFADCVVDLAEDKVTVTVMTENDALTAEEVTRIRDAILARCRGMKAQDITVVEVK